MGTAFRRRRDGTLTATLHAGEADLLRNLVSQLLELLADGEPAAPTDPLEQVVQELPESVRPPKRFALVIGAGEFKDSRIPALPACSRDARALAATLTLLLNLLFGNSSLLPGIRLQVAHGQMRERDLEQVMLDFYHRRFNVLLCTTIIESGIDVPTANTIIIDRADRLGLAQLHQLRGRVGRSHHRAYAYLLTPPQAALTADAEKRLQAIESLEDLIIDRRGDAVIRLSDVATVELSHFEVQELSYFNGKPTLSLSVSREPGSNVIDIKYAMLEAVERVRQDVLEPAGMTIWS